MYTFLCECILRDVSLNWTALLKACTCGFVAYYLNYLNISLPSQHYGPGRSTLNRKETPPCRCVAQAVPNVVQTCSNVSNVYIVSDSSNSPTRKD